MVVVVVDGDTVGGGKRLDGCRDDWWLKRCAASGSP